MVTERVSQGVKLPFELEMDGPGCLSSCCYCDVRSGPSRVDGVSAIDLWRHLRYF